MSSAARMLSSSLYCSPPSPHARHACLLANPSAEAEKLREELRRSLNRLLEPVTKLANNTSEVQLGATRRRLIEDSSHLQQLVDRVLDWQGPADHLVLIDDVLLDPVQCTASDRRLLIQFVDEVHARLVDHQFSIEALARSLAMSRGRLHRKVKGLTGRSPSSLVRRLRLLKARTLLLQARGNVSEVCFEVGFNNLAWFSKTFKQEFGCSPSDLRKTS